MELVESISCYTAGNAREAVVRFQTQKQLDRINAWGETLTKILTNVKDFSEAGHSVINLTDKDLFDNDAFNNQLSEKGEWIASELKKRGFEADIYSGNMFRVEWE
jgi:hypothetical protein